MIEMAAWRPCRRSIGDQTIELQRGEFTASIRFLATRWGVDKGRVERFINRLKTEAMIETRTETGQLVIRICNYDKFQLVPGATETPAETGARQEQDRSETKKNAGNSGNPSKAPESSLSVRGTRLPADFKLPDLWRAYARQKRPELNPSDLFENFKDYWLEQPGQRGVKADWDATWRRWVRTEKPNGQSFKGSASGRSGHAAEREQRAREDERRRRAGLASGLFPSDD
jgi:hypothetical protein